MVLVDSRLSEEWSEHIKVTRISVSPSSTLPFEVRYNGNIILLPPNSSAEFSGGREFPIAGEWILRSTLPEGEECPLNAPPVELSLDVEIICM